MTTHEESRSPAPCRVAVVGTGEMGAMLVRAHARYGDPKRFPMQVANRSDASLDSAMRLAPAAARRGIEDIGRNADLLFLCVPAEATLTLAADLRPQLEGGCIVATIASGIRMEDLAAVLPQPIVRVTPNVGHDHGRGSSLLTAGPQASRSHLELVQSFMGPFSDPVIVTDHDARVATDITSCGPAILARMMEAVAATAAQRAQDLTAAQTAAMVKQTVMTVASLLEVGWTAADICKAVATPGGTTEAALDTIDCIASQGIDQIFDATVRRQQRQRDAAVAALAAR